MKKHLRYIIILIMILTTINGCQAQKSDYIKLPHLTDKESAILNDKSDKEILYGDIVGHTTNGELELNEILTATNKITNQEKIDICIAILQNDNLYHLHDRAAIEISGKIDSINVYRFGNQKNIDYIILRTSIQLNQVLYPGSHFSGLDKEQIEKLSSIINLDKTQNQTKKYLIEALYSLAVSDTNGKYINDKINGFEINDELKVYNDSLFKTFQLLKPSFERLNAIRTWKEMDKNYKAIYEMFENYHPIMFLQLLSFNPSTVLESKVLCELKQNALIEIIKNAETTSFYSTYRLAYLIELLIEKNYTVRFLDQLMDKKVKNELINELELKKY